MTRTAWIGLGNLGLPMAARIAAAGVPLAGVDKDPARAALAQARGIKTEGTLEHAVAGARIVVTSLPSDAAVLAVTTGAGGLCELLPRGAILAETSTIAPDTSRIVAERAAGAGIAYLRLPMSGSTVLAEQGTLSCFASGPRAAFAEVEPMLAHVARLRTWLGKDEEARYAKLAINLMVAVTAGSLAEALALGRKGGIGYRQMLDVIGNSVMGSPFVKYKAGPLAERDFTPTATSKLLAKDLDLILHTAHAEGVPVPLAAAMREIYSAIIALGDGEADFITTVRHTERLAGLGEPEDDTRSDHA